MKTNSILLLLCIVLLSSCAGKFGVMKRRYNKGFYVSVSGERKNSQVVEEHKKALRPARADMVQPEKKVENSFQATALKAENHAPAEERRAEARSNSGPVASAGAPLKAAPSVVRSLAAIKEIQKAGSETSSESGDGDTDLILLVILAIFIPPLAVYLKDKAVSKWFWIVLILSLLGLVGWWVFPFAALAWLLAVIFAILYVLDKL
jgi:uncharacterized membrane protein YqaE (UPF0057 family)